MKKRIVSLILCGLMVFSAAGCSGGGENKAGKDDVTLTMWTHINEPWNAAYKDAIKEFESENEGVRIKLETFPYDEFESKVQTALIDGEGGADIYELWGGWALDFTPYGTLMELPEEMAEKVREENYEPTYGALEYEDVSQEEWDAQNQIDVTTIKPAPCCQTDAFQLWQFVCHSISALCEHGGPPLRRNDGADQGKRCRFNVPFAAAMAQGRAFLPDLR